MRTSRAFSSSLAPSITSYVSLKQALGRRFAKETDILAHLDRFLVSQGPVTSTLTPEIFASWCITLGHLTPTVRRNWMRIVRNLCLYLRRTEPDCFVPDPSAFPAPHVSRRPSIFSEKDIGRLLRSTADLRPRSTAPLYAEGLRLSVVLLYTAGLRRGELARLVLSDYDPLEATLLIRASKFHKSRLVALSGDATRELELYLHARRRLPHDADSPLLVARSKGLRGRSGPGLGHSLHRLFRRAGVRTALGGLPRVHDLRHTHAVHVLLRWYRAGVDVQAKLPSLAASMGHVSIASTAYYLAFLEPVAEAASERFAEHCSHLLPPIVGEGGDR
jgi:integrase/recombinase XerD